MSATNVLQTFSSTCEVSDFKHILIFQANNWSGSVPFSAVFKTYSKSILLKLHTSRWELKCVYCSFQLHRNIKTDIKEKSSIFTAESPVSSKCLYMQMILKKTTNYWNCRKKRKVELWAGFTEYLIWRKWRQAGVRLRWCPADAVNRFHRPMFTELINGILIVLIWDTVYNPCSAQQRKFCSGSKILNASYSTVGLWKTLILMERSGA